MSSLAMRTRRRAIGSTAPHGLVQCRDLVVEGIPALVESTIALPAGFQDVVRSNGSGAELNRHLQGVQGTPRIAVCNGLQLADGVGIEFDTEFARRGAPHESGDVGLGQRP